MTLGYTCEICKDWLWVGRSTKTKKGFRKVGPHRFICLVCNHKLLVKKRESLVEKARKDKEHWDNIGNLFESETT